MPPGHVGLLLEEQALDAAHEVNRVPRKRRIGARIDDEVGAGRDEALVELAKADIGDARAAAGAQPRRERTFDAAAPFVPRVAKFVARILAPSDGKRALDARERPGRERPIDRDADAPLAAPRRGHGDPAAFAQRIDEAHAGAIGEAVAVGEVDDRQPHPEAAKALQRPGHQVVVRDAGMLVHQQDDENVRRVVDRSKALADFDIGKAATACRSLSSATFSSASVTVLPTVRPASASTSASGVV